MRFVFIFLELTALVGAINALPPDCTKTYVVNHGDSCSSLGTKFGSFNFTQLYHWNPQITRQCLLVADQKLCIETRNSQQSSPLTPPGTILPDSADPVPVYPCAPANCAKWFVSGPTLGVAVASKLFGIGDNLWKWNFCKKDSPRDSEMWQGYWYCMELKV